ncbi:AraC family transcriptional regulator [Leptospira perolatii]|uniref:AraC family transcriptional regulator n=1 Tax=Leptospira perolatii TaxID=2023191 RepID=A0A2M9ZJJ5_9LEPT|nr:helix-turn-helix domain-containing protein [Leptospira perolatii]PJZ68871.1 AraC family transcriptional regulator [Leptospira perolatii]PJZ72202.1 AraC family transcriptional regulator [Leptospira perolatii]
MLGTEYTVPVVYFGSALSFLIAIQKVVPEQRTRENYLTALLFLSLGIILFSVANVILKIDQVYPHSIFLLLTSFSMVGPLTLIYTHALLYPNQPMGWDLRLHFMLPMIFFLMELIFFVRPIHSIIADLRDFREVRWRHFLGVSFVIATIATTGYFIARYRMLGAVSSVQEVSRQVRFIFILASITMIAMLSLVGGFLGNSEQLFIIGALLVSLIVVMLFLAPARYHDFFGPLTREVRKKKYERSLLVGVDLNLLELRIQELMREKRLYREAELTLQSLSKELQIKPYQLTEFLNEHLKIGFYSYINKFRIEEAVSLLSENPDQDILSVCYFVGFNSKSSFNDAFRKITGKTPRELRSPKKKGSKSS